MHLIRGRKLNSRFAPTIGRYRYDGVYLPVYHFMTKATWHKYSWITFVLVRVAGQAPLGSSPATTMHISSAKPIAWRGHVCEKCHHWNESDENGVNACKCPHEAEEEIMEVRMGQIVWRDGEVEFQVHKLLDSAHDTARLPISR